jgi:hypothetical protein
MRTTTFFVMAGLVPAIHAIDALSKDVDARHKAGHDEAYVESYGEGEKTA